MTHYFLIGKSSQKMKRKWPFILIHVGLFMLLGGLIYDVMFAGIPYQDPTPEMMARYANHSSIATTTCRIGAAVFSAGVAAGVIRWLFRRLGSSRDYSK